MLMITSLTIDVIPDGPIHVHATGAGHVLDPACPCGPVYLKLCPACGGRGAGCRSCDRGRVPATRDEAVVVVHRD